MVKLNSKQKNKHTLRKKRPSPITHTLSIVMLQFKILVKIPQSKEHEEGMKKHWWAKEDNQPTKRVMQVWSELKTARERIRRGNPVFLHHLLFINYHYCCSCCCRSIEYVVVHGSGGASLGVCVCVCKHIITGPLSSRSPTAHPPFPGPLFPCSLQKFHVSRRQRVRMSVL